MKRVDVIISGGGMIGSIAAVAAVQAGFSVLLIESNKKQTLNKNTPRDLRVSAISHSNLNYLKKASVYFNLFLSRVQPYDKMQVWDNRSDGEINFEADYSQQSYLGCLIENNNLIQAAWKTLENSDACEILEQSKIKSIESFPHQVRVELEDDSQYKSKLLVAAEGRNSFVREYAGIKTKDITYHQKGLVAYIKLGNAPQKAALQGFNEGGPIGILPIKKGLFSIVWSLPEKNCDHWLKCSESSFEQGVKSAIGKDFGHVKLVSQRAAFPLTQMYAESYFNQRIVLCGDSAHGVHPLAGQGVNLGIEDIQLLIKVLNKESLKDDILLHQSLRKYQRRRMSKVKETSEMMSLLHHLFKDDKHIKQPLRNLGLNILDKLPIKKWFINQAGS